VIDYGQYLFEGTAAEVQAHSGVIDAYLGGVTA
jgi:ABC-type branched-subunit amino acid transport system ATPase component